MVELGLDKYDSLRCIQTLNFEQLLSRQGALRSHADWYIDICIHTRERELHQFGKHIVAQYLLVLSEKHLLCACKKSTDDDGYSLFQEGLSPSLEREMSRVGGVCV